MDTPRFVQLHVDGKPFLFPLATSIFDISEAKVCVHPGGWVVDESPDVVRMLLDQPAPTPKQVTPT